MKKSIQTGFILILLAAFVFLSTSFTSTGQDQKNDNEIVSLSHKIDSLSQKVAKLEKRVQKLEDQRLSFSMPRQYFHSPNFRIPPDWREYNYQGRSYFIVPLQELKDHGIIKSKRK